MVQPAKMLAPPTLLILIQIETVSRMDGNSTMQDGSLFDESWTLNPENEGDCRSATQMEMG